MGPSRSSLLRALALALAFATAGTAGGAAHAAPAEPTAAPARTTAVSSDSLPTAQLADGVAWTQAVIGSTVYVGGSFSGARSAGEDGAPTERTNLLAYDLATGGLLPFAPELNGQVTALAASPDGSTLYVGGEFTAVNGTTRPRVAALDPVTGAIQPWSADVNGPVGAIAVSEHAVYLGGSFTAVDGVPRARAAAVLPGSGALTVWSPPSLDGPVTALVVDDAGARVALGGRFSRIGGVAGAGFAIVDGRTGASVARTPVRPLLGPGVAVHGLSSDGRTVYASGSSPATEGFDGSFAVDWATGATRWVADCRGDQYANAVLGGVVYVVGDPFDCGTVQGGFPEQAEDGGTQAVALSAAPSGATLLPPAVPERSLDLSTQPSPRMLDWFPDLTPGTATGLRRAAYSVVAAGEHLLVAGEFPTVNGQPQRGIARFALPELAPNRVGPQLAGEDFAVSASTVDDGTARLAWQANTDRDDERLSYTLYRGDEPIHTETATSRWYDRPTLAFTDTGVTPGRTYEYTVVARDPFGNAASSGTLRYTVPGTVGAGYTRQVVTDGATNYWRFGGGGTAAGGDSAGSAYAAATGGVRFDAEGPVQGDAGGAAEFDGAAGSMVTSNARTDPSDTFSIEAWFRTREGGVVVGADGGTKVADHDREIAVTPDGHVTFTVVPGARRTLRSPGGGYADGAWHHVVGTLSAAGQVLYVDGAKVAADPATTRALGREQRWAVGGDGSAAGAFTGAVDEVAVYAGRALEPSLIARHAALGRSSAAPANTAPTAAFTPTAKGLTVRLDASKSRDADGRVTAYAWDLGDGATATGRTATHTFAEPGAYTVALRVTDDDGATGVVTRTATVQAPNTDPVPSFTAKATGLGLAVDGSASSDADGTVAAYAWSFGDGATAKGATATHEYAAPGTYSVELTVTDDRGATASTTREVTVVAPTDAPPQTVVVAADDFDRTAAGSLSAPATGGAYEVSGAEDAVVAGGVAKLTLTAGSSAAAVAGSSSARDTDARLTVTLPALPAGGSASASVIARAGGDGDYRARLVVTDGGAPVLQVTRAGEVLDSVELPSSLAAAGEPVRLRLQVSGGGTTTVRAKAWAAGADEPGWSVDTTDGAGLPAGLVGFGAGAGDGADEALVIAFDDLRATGSG